MRALRVACKRQMCILGDGVARWNAWRSRGTRVDLRGADLSRIDLGGIDLRDADMEEAVLRGTNLEYARLDGASRFARGQSLRCLAG